MAHELEIISGQAQMAYAESGKLPWHGLGKKVSNDLTPDEMLVAAGLDWSVEKQDMFLGNGTKVDQKALVRSNDSSVLTYVSDSWNPTQNKDAFEFFNDFVLSGNMEMHTAGSLKDGKMVWALAKVKESFVVFGEDQVDSYLLFSNPHQFGKSIDVRFVATRVVCMNTLNYALGESAKTQVRINHCRKFDGDMVKQTLGISKSKLDVLKEQALFLGSKRYTQKTAELFFDKVYPMTSEDKVDGDSKLSRTAKKAMDVLNFQPGHNFAEGTYWQLFNTITYMSDHVVGRSVDSRLFSSWYGVNKDRKMKALDLALDMANVA